MENLVNRIRDFYKNKTILVTGHTGFKGSWLVQILLNFECNIVGYSLNPPTTPNLYSLLSHDERIESVINDVRNYKKLERCISKYKPDIIFHLAAQPLVRESYKDPLYTYKTNILGTLNILEIIRNTNFVKSFINITTDKVYNNREWVWGYREYEELDGFDPYSNSKSISELITNTYRRSFLNRDNIAVSTVRAGNVIGGGDFSLDRIIPDCVRAAYNKQDIIIRNPNSVRPYQHVLESLFAYIYLGMEQTKEIKLQGAYNIGPHEQDAITTGNLANLFCDFYGNGISWVTKAENDSPHESNYLKLDISKIKNNLGWEPKLTINEAMKFTVEWYKAFNDNKASIPSVTNNQIIKYMEML